MRTISGTKEWSTSSANVSAGCPHNCLYGYCHAMAARFGRVPVGGWTDMQERPDAWDRLYGKRKGRIMFPTVHDIVPGQNLNLCIHALGKMLRAGNEVMAERRAKTTRPLPMEDA